MEILSLHKLSSSQQTLLSELYDKCLPEEKIHLHPNTEILSNLFPELPPHHLVLKGDQLIGYLGLVSELDLEARFFVDPSFRRMGVGQNLVNRWIAYGKQVGGQDWLTTCSHLSEGGRAFLMAQKAKKLHSEFLLEWNKSAFNPGTLDTNMRLVQVSSNHVALYSKLVAEIFNSNEEDLNLRFRYETLDSNYQLLLFFDKTELIGTARVVHSKNEALLTTIGIKPNMQGKGLGYQLLRFLLNLLSHARKPIRIEVEIDHPALKLYQKCGFELNGQFAYYRLSFSGPF